MAVATDGLTTAVAPTMTALLGSTTVTRSVATCAAASAGHASAMSTPTSARFIGTCDLPLRERVRLKRRVDLDRFERPLLARLTVDAARDVMRQHHAVDGLVVVEEQADVDEIGCGRRRGL